MKKLLSIGLLMTVAVGVNAGPFRHHHHHRHHYHHGWHRPSFSFHIGAYPSYSPWYAPSYGYYRAYPYAPAYGYSDDTYNRPNYAVGGTLLGALTGGIIGHGVDRQGWEGAGIGAAAGLVLGTIAERKARAQERAYYAAPSVSYSQPAVTAASPAAASIPDAPIVNDAPQVPAAPQVRPAQAARTSSMSAANAMFGR